MKKITFLIMAIIISSCQKEDVGGVPAYIKINSIELENNTTSYITDAWVYINGQLQGVYELPSKFPVLEQGRTNIKVYAGIKNNGISSNRVIYPFYSSDTINELLNINSTTEINPTVYIKENIEVHSDDFETNFTFNYDSGFKGVVFEDGNNYGSLSLSDSDSIIISEINYKDFPLNFENVPQQGSPTYLELDYKSNTLFLVGMYITTPNIPTIEKELLFINPKENWNKIYIDLTQSISEAIGAETFSIYIKMQRDTILDENKLDFDNLRIIHYEK